MIKKILVSQPKPASDKSPYYDIANEYGVELVFRPFFKVEGEHIESYGCSVHFKTCHRQLFQHSQGNASHHS